MLARGIIEDSVVSFLTWEDPNSVHASEAISEKVIFRTGKYFETSLF